MDSVLGDDRPDVLGDVFGVASTGFGTTVQRTAAVRAGIGPMAQALIDRFGGGAVTAGVAGLAGPFGSGRLGVGGFMPEGVAGV